MNARYGKEQAMTDKDWINKTIQALAHDIVIFQEWKLKRIKAALKRAMRRGASKKP